MASARAISRCADLEWRAGAFYRHAQPLLLRAPHWQPLHAEAETEVQAEPQADSQTQRAHADALALRQRFSDAVLHRQLTPSEPLAALVFEWLEQLRVESLATQRWPGAAQNLRTHFEHWSLQCLASAAGQTELGVLLLALAQMAWSRLNGLPLDEPLADAIEAPRARMAPVLGSALAALRRHRADQAASATAMTQIARWVQQLAGLPQQQQVARWLAPVNNAPLPPGAGVLARWLRASSLGVGSSDGGVADQAANAQAPDAAAPYKVFNPAYDREFAPQTTLRAARLRELREGLDQQLRSATVSAAQLAQRFRAALALPARSGWRLAQEQGLLDRRRLTQVVVSPLRGHVFRQPAAALQADCALVFLLDCSGSMKAPMAQLAPLLDLWVRALDLAGVQTEVLGYTTVAWGGGRPQREWLAAGKPAAPGRLNERCHLIFKSAAQSWRRARLGLAALAHSEMFREGVDGEALAWACQRARALAARRRLVLMVSDGCPMERATQLANGDHYLEQHLLHVVALQTALGGVELLGLGAAADLSLYFKRHARLAPEQGLAKPWWAELDLLFAPAGARGSRYAAMA